MASPIRNSHTVGGRSDYNNNDSRHRPETIYDVRPLNSMPYVGPPLENSYTTPLPTQVNNVPCFGPAMVFLPSPLSEEEWDRIVEFTKCGVALTGSAAKGKVGQIVGQMDIGECADSYFFRVALPGVSRDRDKFNFNIQPDGKIVVKGVTTTGEKIVCKHSQVFEMKTQNLCPPGHFSVSFQLPGPVDCLQQSVAFGLDGILQGTVRKK